MAVNDSSPYSRKRTTAHSYKWSDVSNAPRAQLLSQRILQPAAVDLIDADAVRRADRVTEFDPAGDGGLRTAFVSCSARVRPAAPPSRIATS
jgi:hypothetical protein